jgi:ribosome-associated translation inhibitor RaiA
MQTPARITFHELPASPPLEADTHRYIEGLEKVFDRIVSCHVTIEAPHRHHQQGGLFRVLIELGLPGRVLVVGRSPDEHAAHADAHVALRDAFRAARRQLREHAKRLRAHAVEATRDAEPTRS